MALHEFTVSRKPWTSVHGGCQKRFVSARLDEIADYLKSIESAPPGSQPASQERSGQPLKDHEIAQMVNQLRDIALEFHGAQLLRERIAGVLVPALQVKRT